MADLTPFEGLDVVEVAIIITNTGDGLSKAMDVEPIELHVGDRRTVVLDVEVVKIRFDPIKDRDDLRRVQILRASEATFVDRSLVAEVLDEQRAKILAAQRAKAVEGATSADRPLPFDGLRECRECHCTEEEACFGGCSWVEDDLCSTCVEQPMTEGERALREQHEADE